MFKNIIKVLLKALMYIAGSIFWIWYMVRVLQFIDNKLDNMPCRYHNKLFSFCSLKFLVFYMGGILILMVGAGITYAIFLYTAQYPYKQPPEIKKTTT